MGSESEFNLYKMLHDSALLASKVRQKELKKYNISTSQSAILDCVVSSKNNASPSQISRWLFREAQSISMILNRMEKSGLIKRTRNSKRKNLISISLTNKGRKIHNLTSQKTSIKRMMSVLSKEERKQLILCLEKLKKINFELLQGNDFSKSEFTDTDE